MSSNSLVLLTLTRQVAMLLAFTTLRIHHGLIFSAEDSFATPEHVWRREAFEAGKTKAEVDTSKNRMQL